MSIGHLLLSRRIASVLSCRLLHSTGTTYRMSSAPQTVEAAQRLDGLDKNVWVEFNGLTSKYKPVNLGQGFPDIPPPSFVLDALTESCKNHLLHQYTRGQGHPRLVNALAKLYSPLHGREIDPMNEIIVSCGAYSALAHVIQSFVHAGDEVIVIEPFFDCYVPMVKMAGGNVVYVPLRPQGKYPGTSRDWTLDRAELEAAFSDKTKMFIFNTPNNPLGKVFTVNELEMIADLCKRHNVLCVSDEVYEWLVYEGNQHHKIATLPDMWERTVTIGSCGKTFHTTGWKTGWAIGPAYFIKKMHIAHTQTSYTHVTPIQEAIAVGLEKETGRFGQPDSFLVQTRHTLQRKRDEIADVLKEVGFDPIVPDGGYFMLADMSKCGKEFEDTNEEAFDFQLAKWMIAEKGLGTIPPTSFFGQEHRYLSGKLLRFCFMKDDSTLQAAYKLLRDWAKERQAAAK